MKFTALVLLWQWHLHHLPLAFVQSLHPILVVRSSAESTTTAATPTTDFDLDAYLLSKKGPIEKALAASVVPSGDMNREL